ncbi:MAG: biotin transport system substrate-specific component [Alphaproteobacteria bacterium]
MLLLKKRIKIMLSSQFLLSYRLKQKDTLVGSIFKERIVSPLYILSIVLIGSALLTISAKISIPFFPVPMTMQTFAVCVIAMTFGRIYGTTTILFYLLQGLAGIPVFAGGAGIAYMTGPTGGYLLGFLLTGIVLGGLSDRGWGKSYLTTISAICIGTLIIYMSGVIYLSNMIGIEKAIMGGFLPFYPAEIFKILLATLLIPSAWRFFNKRSK